jgi:hypothetical protein
MKPTVETYSLRIKASREDTLDDFRVFKELMFSVATFSTTTGASRLLGNIQERVFFQEVTNPTQRKSLGALLSANLLI